MYSQTSNIRHTLVGSKIVDQCRRCSNYMFILDLITGFNGLGKDNCKTRPESFKFCDLVRLILKILRLVLLMMPLIGAVAASVWRKKLLEWFAFLQMAY